MFPGGASGSNAGASRGSASRSGRGARLYEILELQRDADAQDVKKAYRRLAVLHHPDKGGDPEKFKDIALAYEVLSDRERRRVYDERGEEGLSGSACNPTDIFQNFFNSGSARTAPFSGRGRTKDIIHPLAVTLEQLYTGCTKKIAVRRRTCERSDPPRRCDECCGQGEGHMTFPKSNCPACAGTGVFHRISKEREILEVFVEKGTPNGHKYVFHGKADEEISADPGDVIFVINQQDHHDFRRRGADLFLAREITLLEALTGFRLVIEHLDKRRFVAHTNPGEVVQPLADGTGLKALKDEGMPTFGSPFILGTLFLIFTIKFPDAIDPQSVPKLRQALQGPPEQDQAVNDEESDVEVCFLEDMDPTESAKASAQYAPKSKEDEERKRHAAADPFGPCAQQ